MKWLIAVAVLTFGGIASAQETPKFYLNADGTVEQRLAKVERTLDSIADRLTAIEKKLDGAVAAKPSLSTSPAVTNSGPRPAVGHTHMDSRGNVWDHTMDNGSHLSPWTGEYVTTVSGHRYVSGAPYYHGGSQQSYSIGSGDSIGGCSGPGCSVETGGRLFRGWYLGKNLGRRR